MRVRLRTFRTFAASSIKIEANTEAFLERVIHIGHEPYRPNVYAISATYQTISVKSNAATDKIDHIHIGHIVLIRKNVKFAHSKPRRSNKIGPHTQVNFVYVADLDVFVKSGVGEPTVQAYLCLLCRINSRRISFKRCPHMSTTNDDAIHTVHFAEILADIGVENLNCI